MGAVALLAAPAVAQSGPDHLRPLTNYAELYVENPEVSGHLLVGLRWGGPAEQNARFDPHDVSIHLPSLVKAGKVCVDVVSKDGRYTAQNLYAVDATDQRPILDGEHQFEDKLKQYLANDMAVMVRLAPSCDDNDGQDTIVPAVVTPLNPRALMFDPGRLTAYVNADPDKVGFSLIGPANKMLDATVSCSTPGSGVRIAYSAVCVIEPRTGLPADGVTLRLATRERFKTVSTDFTVIVSP